MWLPWGPLPGEGCQAAPKAQCLCGHLPKHWGSPHSVQALVLASWEPGPRAHQHLLGSATWCPRGPAAHPPSSDIAQDSTAALRLCLGWGASEGPNRPLLELPVPPVGLPPAPGSSLRAVGEGKGQERGRTQASQQTWGGSPRDSCWLLFLQHLAPAPKIPPGPRPPECEAREPRPALPRAGQDKSLAGVDKANGHHPGEG